MVVKTAAPTPPTPPPGFDPLAQGAKRNVYYVPSFKARRPGHDEDGDTIAPVQVATSHNEYLLLLQLEFDPHVRWFCRGDLADEERLRWLAGHAGRPLAISYVHEGEVGHYLPDYVGELADGRGFLAEAGDALAKSADEARAKLHAGYDWIRRRDGVFWFGSQAELSQRELLDRLQFHLARFSYRGPGSLVAQVRQTFATEALSLRDLGQRFPKPERPAVWHAALFVLGEANAAGRLRLPAKRIFDLDTPIDLRPRAGA